MKIKYFSNSDVNCKTDALAKDIPLCLYLDKKKLGNGTRHGITDFKMLGTDLN